MGEPSNFTVRDMRSGEEARLWRLFHETIRHVNIRDYTPEQVAAWSPEGRDMQEWNARLQAIKPFVVVCAGEIVGYSDVQDDGLIDHMFVHHEWQGRGVASSLMDEVERRARARGIKALHAHVSITARPFFERRGFLVARPQNVVTGGVSMTNYLMRRALSD